MGVLIFIFAMLYLSLSFPRHYLLLVGVDISHTGGAVAVSFVAARIAAQRKAKKMKKLEGKRKKRIQ